MTATLPDTSTAPAAPPHGRIEDVLGLLTGTWLASIGLYLLQSAHAVTGGTAGLSLLLHYATGVPVGVLLLVVNAPFFALAARRKGLQFTVRSLICTVGLSVLTSLQPAMLGPLNPSPLAAVVSGNLLAGVGILILFRHRSSLGGFSIVALIAQERLGWRAGYVQMSLDVTVVLASFTVAAAPVVLISAVGAVVLNLVLALNHRPGRYLA
ncbi:YitT family protein [Actinotalea sp. M2MS4P-6]|uniref:YitT family protein n=1 Tax=Actinotalea sp. M2MS4P-6 TaxID=2983762 RepID=UPI0021E4A18F|nr:YitT family protein [Actinotalea sp. M2MS4P-6]MCV2393450.1 YitT family protein [Actinotalea sp. M2MS4P-6]